MPTYYDYNQATIGGISMVTSSFHKDGIVTPRRHSDRHYNTTRGATTLGFDWG